MANSKFSPQSVTNRMPKTWLGRGCLVYVVLTILTCIIGAVASLTVNTPPNPPANSLDQTKTDVSKPVSSQAKVRVHFYNETKNRPLDRKSEIWFRLHGPWWLSTVNGSDFKVFGPRPTNVKLEKDETLVLYPDGRGKDDTGQRIDVPIMLTDDMNPEGSHRDAVTIEINDEKVVMSGLPIKAATGSFEFVVPRL